MPGDPSSDAVAPPRGLRVGARLITRYARTHPRPFILATTAAAGFGLVTVVWSWALGRVVDGVIEPHFAGRSPGLLLPLALLASAGLGRVVTAIVRRFNAATLQHATSATWRDQVVDRLLLQDLSFYRRHPTGDLLAAAENDAEAAVAVLAPLPYSLGVFVLLITSMVWTLYVDIVLGLAMWALLPTLAAANAVFERKVQGPLERVQEGVAQLSGTVHELVDGFGVVKALGLEPKMHADAKGRVDALAVAKIEAVRIRTFFEAGQELLPVLANVSMILLGGWRVRAETMTVGEVVAVMTLLNLVIWPLRLLGWALSELPRSIVGSHRIDQLLQVPVPPVVTPHVPLVSDHVLELDHVTVTHDDGRVALNDVSLNVVRGTRLAIVGPTGSGKTTLLDVMSGLETPTLGERRCSAATPISYVFQEPAVIAGSMHDNLTLGRPIPSGRINAAVQLAEVSEFASQLTHGLHTVVGERGVTLSGGQRQRLALARALAGEPDVLLLDDTTSSLDAQTEERIIGRLAEVADRTIVVVASRPSTIAFADEVVLIDNGRIAARGTHAELSQTSWLYRELFSALTESSSV